MGKKKTVFVWILLVLTAIYLIFGVVSIIFNLININKLLTPTLFSNPTVNVISLISSIIGLVITAIFFTKLYNVRPDVFKWVHIAFGYSIFNFLLSLYYVVFLGLGLASGLSVMFGGDPSMSILFLPIFFLFIIPLGVIILIWIIFISHLRKAHRENLMDFS